jgi:hypothetical protein
MSISKYSLKLNYYEINLQTFIFHYLHIKEIPAFFKRSLTYKMFIFSKIEEGYCRNLNPYETALQTP